MVISCLALINIDAIVLMGSGRTPDPSLLPMVTALLVMTTCLAVGGMCAEWQRVRERPLPVPSRAEVVRRFGIPGNRRY